MFNRNRIATFIICTAFGGLLHAATIDTTDPAVIAAFQSGATVVSFDNISGVNAQTITSYKVGDPVDPKSFIFDQIPGVQFSVGGAVGTNEPAVYQLSGGIAGDAKSGTNVLGSVDFDFTTRFNTGALIEIFFPTKVSQVGFWLNPSLGDVELIALDTNFAFSHIPDTNLEVVDSVTAGHFVGIQRPTADIGGFKIEAKGTTGFTIDDFTFGGSSTTATTTPEPGTLILLGCGLAGVAAARFRRKR